MLLLFREIAEWIIQKDEILNKTIYGIVGKQLFRAAHKLDGLSGSKKRILQKCMRQCFRGVFMQRSGVDLKILKALLKLQREFDVSSYQV